MPQPQPQPPADEPSWSVLREDFMKGSKLRDWDKGQEDPTILESDSADDCDSHIAKS